MYISVHFDTTTRRGRSRREVPLRHTKALQIGPARTILLRPAQNLENEMLMTGPNPAGGSVDFLLRLVAESGRRPSGASS